MRVLAFLAPSLFSVVVSSAALATPTLYKIDSNHSTAQFRVKHLGISSVTGNFSNVQGTILLDDKDLSTAKVEATIDASTIDTDNDKRDEHLKSADFFDTAKFPKITFTSTKWTKTGDGYDVAGDLTMHGVTKPVVLKLEEISAPVKNPGGGIARGTSASVKINRKDFGLTWNKVVEGGAFLVGDEIKVSLDIEGLRAVDQPAAAAPAPKKQ